MGAQSIDWLGVPLRIQGRTIGVLAVQSYAEGVRYSEEDKALLQFVADQVAAAIERTRSEQALRESESRFRTLAETTAIGIVIVEAGPVIYANPAAKAITGWSRDELLSGGFLAYVYPEDSDRVAERAGALLRGAPVPAELEFRIVTRSGQVRWVYASAGRMVLHRGPALVTTFFDVTDRRLAEEEMSRIRQYLKNIIDSMPSVLVGVDPQGGSPNGTCRRSAHGCARKRRGDSRRCGLPLARRTAEEGATIRARRDQER